MTTALENYRARMQRALDHIERHLDGNLDLETLSRVAAFSRFHFHRQFTALFEISVHRYVQLARLKRASQRLVSSPGRSITEIALEAGYDAPDAFARAFRRRFRQSPSSFRRSPDWAAWLQASGPLDNARSKLMSKVYIPADVTLVQVPDTPVAILEHRGDRATLPATIERFIAWRKAAGLSPYTSPTFNIFRSERTPADPAGYSMDLCVGTDRPIDPGDPVMKPGIIPGGRCAMLHVPHNTNNLEPEALYLYREWLPASGEEARDFPIYCRRRFTSAPGAPMEATADLFLPLK
jgi:AraC family transcriptional regulator